MKIIRKKLIERKCFCVILQLVRPETNDAKIIYPLPTLLIGVKSGIDRKFALYFGWLIYEIDLVIIKLKKHERNN